MVKLTSFVFAALLSFPCFADSGKDLAQDFFNKFLSSVQQGIQQEQSLCTEVNGFLNIEQLSKSILGSSYWEPISNQTQSEFKQALSFKLASYLKKLFNRYSDDEMTVEKNIQVDSSSDISFYAFTLTFSSKDDDDDSLSIEDTTRVKFVVADYERLFISNVYVQSINLRKHLKRDFKGFLSNGNSIDDLIKKMMSKQENQKCSE